MIRSIALMLCACMLFWSAHALHVLEQELQTTRDELARAERALNRAEAQADQAFADGRANALIDKMDMCKW